MTWLDARDPSFWATHPWDTVILDRWGRRLDLVVACNPETGEVITYEPTACIRWWWRLLYGWRSRYDYRRFFRCFGANEIASRHGFWPAPLTVTTAGAIQNPVR